MDRAISTTGIIFMALGVVGVLAALLSLSRSLSDRSGRFTPSRELSEAVADPDVVLPAGRAYSR